MVGAVLVHQDRIIGEGYHRQFGGPHAEVNCLASVSEKDKQLVRNATLYVSLEPCSHYGKTPPCTSLIREQQIPKVVVGVQDPFAAVNGSGMEELRNAGVEVVTGVLQEKCRELNRRFFCFHEHHRPYIILKWAQTLDGKISGPGADRLLISHELTNRLVHRWRSEESAILVGTTTALRDNPQLNNRYWPGPSPLRLILDRQLKLPSSLRVFTDGQPTVVLNDRYTHDKGPLQHQILYDWDHLPQAIGELAYANQLQSILVEGGGRLLQSFIDAGYWDEARVISSQTVIAQEGVSAPVLHHHQLNDRFVIGTDQVIMYSPKL
jgi:diaminohydroxyphosphoribosylaminopyrimidine deaminase/5-amino-6-(5-phosphoribosylamino)uracil reductase